TIVCGGTSGASGAGAAGGAAQAQANSACIIINNSDGAIVSTDQSADDSTVTSQNTTGSKSESIDEVANILSGHKQGL
ncbi:MAG: hypothetical protein ABL996_20055, partial [Micropepsaceae bacterium]